MSSDINNAKDKMLQASVVALQRASKMARKIAIQTQTDLIIFEAGHIMRIPAQKLCVPQDTRNAD
ncbi:hypothetical protein MASR1M90_15020 [Desulfovibrionales bacterium]